MLIRKCKFRQGKNHGIAYYIIISESLIMHFLSIMITKGFVSESNEKKREGRIREKR